VVGVGDLEDGVESKLGRPANRQRRADSATALRYILESRRAITPQRAVLVAVTGIDGSGKGYATDLIVGALRASGVRASSLNIDGWLNLPNRRFSTSNPAEHFYHHAIRFEEMFTRLVFPLRDRRSLRLEAEFTEESAIRYRSHVYEYCDIDVLVVEGIFLLRRAFRTYYDLSIWIDCTFDTALERALARRQEGLSAVETLRAYRSIYYPAQEIHFRRDDPQGAATWIINNDTRIGPVDWSFPSPANR
jgi:uridine kinase